MRLRPGVSRTTLVEHAEKQRRERSRRWATQKVGGKWHEVRKRRFDADRCFDTKTFGCGWIRSRIITDPGKPPPEEDRCKKCARMFRKQEGE